MIFRSCQMRGVRRKATILAPVLLFGACTVGPKYSRPAAPVPAAYKEEPPAGWKTAQPGDQARAGKWWEVFKDSRLDELEEQVTLSNQNLKVAEANYRQARSLVRFFRAGRFPTLGGGASVTGDSLSTNRPLRPATQSGSYGDFVLPIDLSYEVDAWGRIRRAVESAGAAAQASAADLASASLSIHAELASDYFQLRSLDAEKQLLDLTVVAYEKALQLTTNRFNGGAAARVEVEQAKTQLETTRAQAIDLAVQRAQLEHAVALLAGQPASTFSIPVSPISVPPPRIPPGVPSELLERRPDIAGAERRIAAANAQIGVAKAAFFPVLTLSAPVGLEGSSITNWLSWPSRFWAVGPSLAQTLFEAGRRRSTVEGAQAAYDAAAASYREAVLAAIGEVEDNLAALRILEDEAGTQDEAVTAARRSLDQSNIRYKGGLVTYLEVVTAQSALLADERAAEDILRRRMAASVLLIKALGGGWSVASLPSPQ